jgi:hypothetical protein
LDFLANTRCVQREESAGDVPQADPVTVVKLTLVVLQQLQFPFSFPFEVRVQIEVEVSYEVRNAEEAFEVRVD